MTGRPPTRPEPNRNDPLSEPSIGRRIWAGYLARGWTRADFARRMEVPYQTVDRWDTEAQVPGLDHIERARALLGFTLTDIVYGRTGGGGGKPERIVPGGLELHAIGLSAEDTDVLAQLVQAYLGEVAHVFFAVYHAERSAGTERARAFKRARDIAHDARARAVQERALATAVVLGAKPAVGFAAPAKPAKRGTDAKRR